MVLVPTCLRTHTEIPEWLGDLCLGKRYKACGRSTDGIPAHKSLWPSGTVLTERCMTPPSEDTCLQSCTWSKKVKDYKKYNGRTLVAWLLRRLTCSILLLCNSLQLVRNVQSPLDDKKSDNDILSNRSVFPRTVQPWIVYNSILCDAVLYLLNIHELRLVHLRDCDMMLGSDGKSSLKTELKNISYFLQYV